MAVLVEANTLIVRRRFLHHHYPGSTRQFLRDARHAGQDVRYAIADRHLAAVSSSDAAPMTRLAQRLEELGATGRDFVRMDGGNGREVRGLDFSGDTGWEPVTLSFRDRQGRILPMWIHPEYRPRCLHVILGIPGLVPPHRRSAVADYLSRANWDLRSGQLQMDWSDGEVRYHACVLVADGTLTPAMVGQMIDAALGSAERFVDGLEQVIGGADAEEAFPEVEDK